MPRGMLVPASAAPSVTGGPLAARMRRAPSPDAGAWIALAPAATGDTGERPPADVAKVAGTTWVSPDAMTLLHDAFARAKPDFDPFRPHLLDAAALRKLDAELAAFAQAWAPVTTAAAAKARFEGSDLVRAVKTDDEWREVRDALLATVDAIRRDCVELAGQGRGLWVVTS